MNETRERPELGTTEAAVRSCVNLIALATHTDEEHLAYWLDLYYQTRKAHEKATKPLELEDLLVKAEEPDPVIVKLGELDYKIETAARAVLSLGDLIRSGEAAAPSPCAGKAEQGDVVEFELNTASIAEATAAQKKKQGSADGI